MRNIKQDRVLVAGIILTGCSTGSNWGYAREKLVAASNDYNALLRWNELDKVCLTYADESVSKVCLERALALKDLHVTDIRRRDLDIKADGIEATVNNEIEYYLLPSTVVRKMQQSQKWFYRGAHEQRVWRIATPFPNFAEP